MTTANPAISASPPLRLVSGNNFSGRTATLSRECEVSRARGELAISLPLEPHLGLSGLSRTVQEELWLHNTEALTTTPELGVMGVVQTLLHDDPFRLSGGQQMMVILAAKLALRPRVFALDCCLEQLDPVNLVIACKALEGASSQRNAQIIISHNGSPLPIRNLVETPPESSDTSIPAPVWQTNAGPSSYSGQPATIRINDLHFRYRTGPWIFEGFSTELSPGRIYRIAGRNGSGKSTFAKLLAGVLKPTTGRIEVNGKRFDSYARPGSLARLHFQSPDAQLFADTVAAELRSLREHDRERAIVAAGLSPYLQWHPFDLPYVLRKRLALALVLYDSAPWLILDEPTLGQDSATRAALVTALRERARAGQGILLISHEEEFALAVSDHTIKVGAVGNESTS